MLLFMTSNPRSSIPKAFFTSMANSRSLLLAYLLLMQPAKGEISTQVRTTIYLGLTWF